MSLIQSYDRRSAPSLSASGLLFRSFTSAAGLARRAFSSWRTRSDLLAIESLPDDLRKDIGWPDGGQSR